MAIVLMAGSFAMNCCFFNEQRGTFVNESERWSGIIFTSVYPRFITAYRKASKSAIFISFLFKNKEGTGVLMPQLLPIYGLEARGTEARTCSRAIDLVKSDSFCFPVFSGVNIQIIPLLSIVLFLVGWSLKRMCFLLIPMAFETEAWILNVEE